MFFCYETSKMIAHDKLTNTSNFLHLYDILCVDDDDIHMLCTKPRRQNNSLMIDDCQSLFKT